MKRLIYFLLSILGIAAMGCDRDGGDDMCMYGTPYVTYKFNARVINPEGKPIKGIEVTLSEDPDFEAEWMEVLKTETNAKGELSNQIGYKNLPATFPLQMRVRDIDGEANGGEYKDEMPHISQQMANATLIKDAEGWCNGTYEVNIGDITLEPVDHSTDAPPIID